MLQDVPQLSARLNSMQLEVPQKLQLIDNILDLAQAMMLYTMLWEGMSKTLKILETQGCGNYLPN